MLLSMVTSKTQRRTQAERSAATRRKILRAARDIFISDGYTATTMTRIADRAGVAVQTVYFVFHTKGELLTKVYEAAVLGDRSPTPPGETDWYQRASTDRVGRQAIATFVSGAAAILRRTAPLEGVVQTASPTEPILEEAHERGEQLRVQGYRRFVDTLRQRGLLREDTDSGEATDVLLSIVGPHMYATLTTDRGWNHQKYVDWASRSVPYLLL
jgi:AcrR family transcriptional regulator